jgi:hypothetical protein
MVSKAYMRTSLTDIQWAADPEEDMVEMEDGRTLDWRSFVKMMKASLRTVPS